MALEQSGRYRLGLVVVLLGLGLIAPARADSIKPLYSFSGPDGSTPRTLLADNSGNFYGTTQYGGHLHCVSGCGTVFRLAWDGTLTVLYVFRGRSDGAEPIGGLVADGQGNLYGTTNSGGAHHAGVVFKIDSNGAETVLHAFGSRRDGKYPEAGLTIGRDGNFYGTTSGGGGSRGSCGRVGCGTVFMLAPDGTETVLHRFTSGDDGAVPVAPLTLGRDGAFYGTTKWGGDPVCGCGTIFRVGRSGDVKTLHAFAGNSDGENPEAPLIEDKARNWYGTTSAGGSYRCDGGMCGTVFKLAADGSESVLHVFADGSDGSYPLSGLLLDGSGNLLGTTSAGGTGCGCGTVFMLAPDGTETILHAFTGGDDGQQPFAGLSRRSDHKVVGTASWGGTNGHGVIFEVAR